MRTMDVYLLTPLLVMDVEYVFPAAQRVQLRSWARQTARYLP